MIRVIVADAQILVRRGISHILNELRQIQVVGEADHGEAAIALIRERKPDIALIEVVMPGLGGLEVTRRITSHHVGTAVIALTAYSEPPFPAQMLKAGARGFVTKKSEPAELETAIRRVYAGKRYVCHEVAQDLASYAVHEHVENPFAVLSHREMQIMMMVVGCRKVSEISGSLHLSPKTVNSYRYRIFEKLQVSSDVELVLLAVRHGMVPVAPLPAGRHAEPVQQQPGQATHHSEDNVVPEDNMASGKSRF